MLISLIASLTINHVIGRHNCIPWSCKLDMEWFKLHTLNKPVIMGRKTFESIGGKGLVGRLNIVLSNCAREVKNKYKYRDVIFVRTPQEAFLFLKSDIVVNSNEVMVIGGGKIYSIFMPYASRLYLTYLNIEVSGDVFFPFFNLLEWKLIFLKFYYNYYLIDYILCFKIFERFDININKLS
ncbi:dihydrofolate reductase [Blochmannia endosymbiont of Camponotus (Colobopsis) obliquus]|uniref:dihydrofolate reductase n=1 Tax=Blochmannia endosymbiont of Camponotus (Colobopsis) obliquus TaxID=1505597 RepID=UPI00061A7D6C|nr:dihydrofolate reductase [Blochmannia endosymbiont of Camponotus (Colobopsis) obliquus]AKC60301.1 dihydrofolate reductase [Blochmannia endosymbiont of Camponotus (Colobopsis) obliquus]